MTSGWDTYNRTADAYRAVRPVYPEGVFDSIESYASSLPPVPRVLEIGAGSGQATRQMLGRGWDIVALEPGADLARSARDDLKDVGRVEIRVSRFEDADLPERGFDLITSATAWHWVDPVVGFPKAAWLLSPGGTMALWWNAHVPDTTEPGWVPIRRVYEQVAPHLARLAPLTPDRPDYDPAGELTASPWFSAVEQRDFPFAVSYTADEFLALIGTYASHRNLDDQTRRRLHAALADTINTELNGRVTKPYNCLLVLATIPSRRRVGRRRGWRPGDRVRDHPFVAPRRRWIDRTRPLWRIGNRIEAFELRRFGVSIMSLLNRGDVLALESIGLRSGKVRYTPLGYWQDEQGAFIIGGGAAGMATVPDWVKNLRHSPNAAVWTRRTRIPVVAHELTGDDRTRAQVEATKIWPGVPNYERKSGRVIPYFRLARQPEM